MPLCPILPFKKKPSGGDPSCQPSVVEISDDNRESERLNNGEPNENVESPESELS